MGGSDQTALALQRELPAGPHSVRAALGALGPRAQLPPRCPWLVPRSPAGVGPGGSAARPIVCSCLLLVSAVFQRGRHRHTSETLPSYNNKGASAQ